jgi:methyl-accepting chemotaxis protein
MTLAESTNQTDAQVTAVAAAADVATGDVQTVASAAEELSASIEEINR